MDELSLTCNVIDAIAINKSTDRIREILHQSHKDDGLLEYTIKFAIQYNDVPALEECLKYVDGFLTGPPNKRNRSLLVIACQRDSLECLQYIYQHDILDQDVYYSGITELETAISYKSYRCTEWLITNWRGDLYCLGFFKTNSMIEDKFKEDIVIRALQLQISEVNGIPAYLLVNAVVYGKYSIASFIMCTCVGNYRIMPGLSHSVDRYLDKWNAVCVYLIHKFQITQLDISNLQEPSSVPDFDICVRSVQSEHRALLERRMAFAMSTHKRLGADSPIQSYLDVNLMDRIIFLSLRHESLKIT